MDRIAVENRRRYPRLQRDFSVQLKQVPDMYVDKIHHSLSKDISEGGLRLTSFNFYPVNSRMLLDVTLSPYRPPVQCVGRVVWIQQMPYQERFNIGIEFAGLSEHVRGELRDLVHNRPARLQQIPA